MARKRAPDAPVHPGHVSVPDYLIVGPAIDVWAPDVPVSVEWMDRALTAWSRWRRARRAWLAANDLDLGDERVPDELRQVRAPRPWSGPGEPPTVPTILFDLPRHDVPPAVHRLLRGD